MFGLLSGFLLSEATMTRKLRETGDEAIAIWPEREPEIETSVTSQTEGLS